ncbi:MAG: type II toxin-antitoxin system Phd/YefM family antitoxin [Natronosporangium sp.]
MSIIPLVEVKARLPAVQDDVRDTHDRVAITRNGSAEAVVIAVTDVEALEGTLDLLSTPGVLDQSGQAEADIAAGAGIDAEEPPPVCGACRAGAWLTGITHAFDRLSPGRCRAST